MRILSARDVRAAVTMPAAIAAMREAFAQLSSGAAQVPQRAVLTQTGRDATTLVMPAWLPQGGQLGVKLVSVVPGNVAAGLPAVPAVVLLLDAATGQPRALMDGTYLTALRTGAASGLATDLLARPDARVVALFGAGGQAPFQLEAICAVRPIERAWIVNRTLAHAARLADQVRAWPAALRPREVRVAVLGDTAHAAVEEADVIAAATSAHVPLFPGGWVRPGTHVNAIGAFTPDARELPADLMARARIVVDQRAAALAEAGDVTLAIAEGAITAGDIAAELGELMLGTRHGRSSRDEITVFKSVGSAAQDVAVADLAYREALRQGLGVEADLEK
jgi:ornithine cyclodeaminase/alanine dehydrogenase-like protein (mu-crystallin family)